MIILEIFVASIFLWLFFIAMANVQKYRGKGYNPVVQALAHLFTFVFAVFDIVLNIVYGSIVFMQLPHWKRLTLTARLKYILYKQEMGWRWKLADFVCRRMIEPWDYNHCGLADE